MYTEWPSIIPHAVVWTGTAGLHPEAHLVLPDGCMDVLWVGGELIIAGPDVVAHRATWAPGVGYVGIRLGAGVGPRIVGVPARVLRNDRVPLSQIWSPSQVRRVTDRLAASTDPAATLEEVAMGRFAEAVAPDPIAAGTVHLLERGASVDQVARTVGVSPRQLNRRCLDAFGYGPKTLARILRLQRALGLSRTGMAAADAAVASGYSDQAHMSRDVKAMTGTTFRSLTMHLPADQESFAGSAANRST